MNQLQAQQLRFAIAFSQLNAKAHEIGGTTKGLDLFFGENYSPKKEETTDLIIRQLPLLSGEARAILQRAVEGRGSHSVKLPSISISVTPATSRRPSVQYTGKFRDLFLLRLAQLLEESGAQNIRTCQAAECGRLFLKVTKKEFCSPRCQSRTYMRTYRETKPRGRNAKTRAR